MSTVLSRNPTILGLPTSARPVANQPRRFDSARSLATLLLAAAVSALVVLANQLIEAWADGHLFLGWVALWVVIFAGSVLFAGTARRLARRTMVGLDSWSRSLAEARAEVRMWELAKRDPRLKAEFLQAAASVVTDPALTVAADNSVHRPLASVPVADLASAAMARRLAQTAMPGRTGYLPYL